MRTQFAILRHNKINSVTKGVAASHNHREISITEKKNAQRNYQFQSEPCTPPHIRNGVHELSSMLVGRDETRRDDWILPGIIPARLEHPKKVDCDSLLRSTGRINSVGEGLISFGDTPVGRVSINRGLTPLNRYFNGKGAVGRINKLIPANRRKDAVEAVELIMTASPEFFNSIEPVREKLSKHPRFERWVREAKGWAEKEFGKNLVDIALHMDESSPHFHILTVPLTQDGRLCAKEITGRAEMQRRQTDFAKAMEPFGLARGISASETKRRHINLKSSDVVGGGAMAEALREALRKVETSVQSEEQAKLDLLNIQDALRQAKAESTAQAKAAAQANGELRNIQGILLQSNAESTAYAVALSTAKKTVTDLKLDLVNVQSAQLEANSKAEAQTKVVIDLTANLVQARLDWITSQRNFKRERNLNDNNRDLISKLELTARNQERAMARVTAELSAAKELLSKALRDRNLSDIAPLSTQVSAENVGAETPDKLLSDFMERHGGLPKATAMNVAHCPAVEICGLAVVLNIGMGKQVLHVFNDAEELELSLSKGKSRGQGQVR